MFVLNEAMLSDVKRRLLGGGGGGGTPGDTGGRGAGVGAFFIKITNISMSSNLILKFRQYCLRCVSFN